MSAWKTQVMIGGLWVDTSVRLATQEEAERLRPLYEARLSVEPLSRAIECEDAVNCYFNEGMEGPLWIPEKRVSLTEEERQAKELDDALRSDPMGGTCGWCGEPNTNVDDCGFHYLCGDPDDPKKSKPACKRCHDGTPGTIHVFRYGVGER